MYKSKQLITHLLLFCETSMTKHFTRLTSLTSLYLLDEDLISALILFVTLIEHQCTFEIFCIVTVPFSILFKEIPKRNSVDFNPLQPGVAYLHPLKKSENL